MKKVLLASSVLALSAGFASAEIALSGSARMGITYDSTLNGGDGETVFSSRVRIVFTASGETDGGLQFGASVRADQIGGNGSSTPDVVTVTAGADLILGTADDIVTVTEGSESGSDGDSNGDSTVYLSGAFGKITMGDVGGAADALVGQVSGVGYGPNDGLHEIGFIGTTKTAVYYEYSTGGLTFGLGLGQVYDVDADTDTADEASIAVKYAAGDYSVALGYETNDSQDSIHLGGSATFGPATVKVRVTDTDVAGDDTAYALSLDYVTGATTITAFYTDFGNTGASSNTQHIGLGAAYDLGGGAALKGGVVMQENDGIDDETFADLGLTFSF